MIDLTEDSSLVSNKKLSDQIHSQGGEKIRELQSESLQNLKKPHSLPTLQKVHEIPQTVQISQTQTFQRVRQLPPTVQLGFGPNMINPLTLNLPPSGNNKVAANYVGVGGPTFYKPLLLSNPGVKSGFPFPQQVPMVIPATAIVFFSLISTSQFTAKSEEGSFGTLAKEVLNTLLKTPGCKFDWKTLEFVYPLSSHDILMTALQNLRVVVEPLPRAILSAAMLRNQSSSHGGSSSVNDDVETEAAEDTLSELRGHIPDNVLHALAPFQRDAVKFVLNNAGRALIADEMGLGKTRTAIASATGYRDEWPVLIVCPSSARHHWQSEILTVLDCKNPDSSVSAKEVTVLETSAHPLYALSINSAAKSRAKLIAYKFVVVSYNILTKLPNLRKVFPFGVVIVDECHYMKNSGAARTKWLMPVIQNCKRAILISGTPALSRPMELFTQLHSLSPQNWPDEKSFGRRYCKGGGAGVVSLESSGDKSGGRFASSRNDGGRFGEFKGASNSKELHVMLTGTIMIRRLKKDVLSQLPPKIRQIKRIEVADPIKMEELRSLVQAIRCLESAKEKRLSEVGQEQPPPAVQQQEERLEGPNPSPPAPTLASTTSSSSSSSSSTSMKNFAVAVDSSGRGDGDWHNEWKDDELIDEKEKVLKKKNLLMQLFRESGIAKAPAVLNWLGTFLDDRLSGKILVFAHHRNVLDSLADFLSSRGEPFIRIDGRTSSKERHARVEQFQSNSANNIMGVRVALLAITAAGIAITLTAASTVLFAEMYWTPGSLIQAEDRAHRIGQVNAVKIVYALADGTVDDFLWPLVQRKMREVVEGQQEVAFAAQVTDSDKLLDDVTALDLASQAKASEREIGWKKRKLPSSSGGQVDCSSDEESIDEEVAASVEDSGEVEVLNPDKLASLFMNSHSANKRNKARLSCPPSGQKICTASSPTSSSSNAGHGIKREGGGSSSASVPPVIDIDGDSDGEAAGDFDYSFMGGRDPNSMNTSSSCSSIAVNAQSTSSMATSAGSKNFSVSSGSSSGENRAFANSSGSNQGSSGGFAATEVSAGSDSSGANISSTTNSLQRSQAFRMGMSAAQPHLPLQSRPTWQENREKLKHVFQPKVVQAKSSSSGSSYHATAISIVDLSAEGD